MLKVVYRIAPLILTVIICIYSVCRCKVTFILCLEVKTVSTYDFEVYYFMNSIQLNLQITQRFCIKYFHGTHWDTPMNVI